MRLEARPAWLARTVLNTATIASSLILRGLPDLGVLAVYSSLSSFDSSGLYPRLSALL